MGKHWNRNGATAQKKTEKKRGLTPAAKWMAAAAVTLIALVAYLAFRSGDEAASQPEEESGRGLIPEVSPASTNNIKNPKTVDPREDYDHTKFYRDERGILRYMTGCRAYDPTRPTRAPYDASTRTKPSVFSNECDIVISRLITKRPGSHAGSRQNYYDPELEAEFKQSLVTPIRIDPNEPPRVQRLKQAVLDARREIAQRIGDGEKLGDILTQTRNELRRLYDYRNDLESDVCKMIEDGNLDNNDVRDVVKAANMMFEKEGLAPLKEDSFVIWNLRLAAEKRGADPNAAEAQFRESQTSPAEGSKEEK